MIVFTGVRWGFLGVTSVHLGSLRLTWLSLSSLVFCWAHWGVHGFTLVHLSSLGSTWDHFDSLGLTFFSYWSTWDHLYSTGSFGFTWVHLDSIGFTWEYSGSLGRTWRLTLVWFGTSQRNNIHQDNPKAFPHITILLYSRTGICLQPLLPLTWWTYPLSFYNIDSVHPNILGRDLESLFT